MTFITASGLLPAGTAVEGQMEVNGVVASKNGYVIRFQDHSMTLIINNIEITSNKVKCYETASGFEIDIGSPTAAEFSRGIYRIRENVLDMCTTELNGERPKNFESTSKLRSALWTLKKRS